MLNSYNPFQILRGIFFNSQVNSDFQLTKEIIFPGVQDLKDCLSIFQFMLKHINVKEDILKDEKYDYLFSVEKINELVM